MGIIELNSVLGVLSVKRKSFILPLIALAIVLACTTLARAGIELQTLSRSLVRFHVVGNSNSVWDQSVKLKVRDAVLAVTEPQLADVRTRAEAEDRLADLLPVIEETANAALTRAGAPYPAKAKLTHRYFPTKEYTGFSLPAGMYDAVTVTLGTGEGRNFWCVLFPPLCLSAASLDAAPDLSP